MWYTLVTVKERRKQRQVNKRKVDFELLMELASESGEAYPIEATIAVLAMCDIPMSNAVIQLGIVTDILMDDYHNGWSDEDQKTS